MLGTRRNFLRGFSASLLGLAGFLIPGKLRAGHRGRRGTGCCPPQTVCCPPPSECCASAGHKPPYMGRGVNICYPNGPAVPGYGGFFTWISAPTGVTVKSCQVTYQGLATPIEGTKAPNLTGCAAAYYFNGLPTAKPITLTVKGSDSSSSSITFSFVAC